VSSKEIYLVVEGPTEQTFIRDVMAPELAKKEIYLRSALIGKPGHKGGDIRFERAKKDIGNFLSQRTDTYVSTMFDYFRIDPDWPGCKTVHQQLEAGITLTATKKAQIIETATLAEIASAFQPCDAQRRFIPYIEMHEFEALLFSEANILAKVANIEIKSIQNILEQYSNPEEINDDPKKAPSKQLSRIKPGYRKVAMGKAVAEGIGIARIRERCPHFNDWLDCLENLVN